ncbi:uncharacterized protein LOC116416306 [Nasonia vitripennis]|uniref:Uncharacterized protein n=1 Tax=Nasonia vitripennis TaxID=7425 RepID=A0A7M7Q349_NASVI|nr:uncharacterized protein LOC116416306 [Nasonia vitripennis]
MSFLDKKDNWADDEFDESPDTSQDDSNTQREKPETWSVPQNSEWKAEWEFLLGILPYMDEIEDDDHNMNFKLQAFAMLFNYKTNNNVARLFQEQQQSNAVKIAKVEVQQNKPALSSHKHHPIGAAKVESVEVEDEEEILKDGEHSIFCTLVIH